MEIRLPQLGEGADSGAVASVFVKEGDQIRADDPLLELESEKAVATIPAPVGGTITRIHVRAGDTVKVGQVLFTVTEAEGAPAPASAPAPGRQAAAAAPTAAKPVAAAPRAGQPVAASPSLRKMAQQLGLDLSLVPASGRGGRLLLDDVRAYLQRLQAPAATPAAGPAAGAPGPAAEPVDFAKWGPITRRPMTQMRKVIARRMHEAWATVPHVTQFDEADVTALVGLRQQYLAEFKRQGTHLTLLPFIIQALVRVLKKHPIFNSSLEDATQEIIVKEYIHLGIAVDTEQGLIVPVLRNADRKGLLELARELEALSQRARDRKLTADDLRGGSFTISNQGAIGSGHYTPIINRPEVAILGMGRAKPRPVAGDGAAVVVRPVLPLTLAYDHRVADGAQAARFMTEFVKELEGLQAAGLRL